MKDRYFQFPISALSFGVAKEWHTILDLACYNYGSELLKKGPLEKCMTTAKEWCDRHPEVHSDKAGRREQLALVLGYAELSINVKSGRLCDRMRNVEAMRSHCEQVPFPTVRIRTDFWWDTFTPSSRESHLSHREFVVLCAVYAAVGAKPYAKASLQMLRRYAAGYPREADFQKATSSKDTPSIMLTSHQVRGTLLNLEALGYFAKFTFNRGECFYTNKMLAPELHQRIMEKKIWKAEKVAAQRSLDQAASAEITRRRALAQSPYAVPPLVSTL